MALIFLLGLKEGPAALLVPLASLPFLASTYLLSWFGGGWLAAEVIRSKRGGRAVVAAAFALLVIDGGIAGQAMIGAALNAPTADEKFFDDLFFLLVVGGIGSLFTFVPIAFCFTPTVGSRSGSNGAAARQRQSTSRVASGCDSRLNGPLRENDGADQAGGTFPERFAAERFAGTVRVRFSAANRPRHGTA